CRTWLHGSTSSWCPVIPTPRMRHNPRSYHMKATDPGEFIANLNAGVFANQLGKALSAVAGAVVDHGKKGQVKVTFDISQIGESHQVKIAHKLEFTEPTAAFAAVRGLAGQHLSQRQLAEWIEDWASLLR